MTTTMAVQSTASQSNNRASLFLRLADVEKERENILRRLGLTDATVTVMPSANESAEVSELAAVLEVLTSRMAKLEAKIFANKLEGQAMVKANGNGHSNGESHHQDSDEYLIAKRATELGCPAEWLFVQEKGGRKFVNIKRGKGDAVKKLQRAAIKESGKTPDEAAEEALKLDNEGFMQWVRGQGRSLIESKRLISKEMRARLAEKIKEIKSA